MIKACIFDLDSCLCAANEVGDQLFEPAFAAVRAANGGALTEEQLVAAFVDCWRHPLDWVIETHGFTSAMAAAAYDAFAEIEVCEPMRGYGDLDHPSALTVARFLVTSGFRRLQESKVAALGIGGQFMEIIVDAIDEPDRRGKQAHMEQILDRHGYGRDDVLVVGDNDASELLAGHRLGLRTVQTLRPGVPPSPLATYRIGSLAELPGVISSLA
jgi:putative hydrolase of the HAD superfamily